MSDIDIGAKIKNAIVSLAHSNHIFSNESQFQFDLAWCLNENHEISKDYDVKLEVLGFRFQENSDKPKKFYIDIVLVNKNKKELIPIELKYKTPQKEISYYKDQDQLIGHTFSQGAPDVGSYLFWKDVERLEKIKNKEIKFEEYENYNIKSGYAVLLTNCPSYLNKSSTDNLYSDFFPYDGFETYTAENKDSAGNTLLCSKIYVHDNKRCSKNENNRTVYIKSINDIKMYDPDNNSFNNALLNPITLTKNYECTWSDYELKDCYYYERKKKHNLNCQQKGKDNSFYYLILKV